MDIDIDTKTHFIPVDVFPNVVEASIIANGKMKKHPAGVYFQKVNIDPNMGISCVPYNIAHHFNLFKVDFLHLSLLDTFETKAEIRELINKEPNWDLLTDTDATADLFQLKNHQDVLELIKPRDVQTLADCVAMIRPGKQHLINLYNRNKQKCREELYSKPLPKGCFKKAHAIAYAFNIILQLHAIEKARTGFCEF